MIKNRKMKEKRFQIIYLTFYLNIFQLSKQLKAISIIVARQNIILKYKISKSFNTV